MNINDIQDNTIIICESEYKNYLLKKLTKNHIFLNVKFYSKKEFLKDFLFSYNEKAVYYLVKKYQYKVEIAKMYLENLYYVDDSKEYKNPKLIHLVKLKKELNAQKLLTYNKNFEKYLGKHKILVVGYPFLDNYELEIFNNLNANIINTFGKYELTKVFEFTNIEEEINFVLKSIGDLLTKGIDINKIKIIGIDDEYYNDLNRLSSFYNIPVNIPTNNTLYSNIITKKFLDNYDSDIKKSIDAIKNENSDIVNKIVNICNKYVFVKDYNEVKDLIINDLKNSNIDNFKLKNFVEIINIESPIDDEFVFLMNFNTGNIPRPIKDENYITDNIKCELNMKSIVEMNKLNKEFIKNKISSIKNLVISYKLKSGKGEYYPSSLINELNLQVIHYKNDILNSYSYMNDLINFAKKWDNYEKYGDVDEEFFVYKNNLKDISYNTYDNSYTKIDKNNLREYLNNKLTLSYSSLNNYNKCAFRYYVANILKLDKYEENFEAFVGSIFHDVLEKCFINKLDVQDEVNNYIENSGKQLSIKERFFVNKIIEDIKYVINVLNKQQDYIGLDKSLYEKNIVIDKSRDILVKFVGFVDKILYKENSNNTLVSIIDYKTGFVDIDLKYVPYGLSLQLPIYLYLVKKSNLFSNPKFVGFYLQYILDKDITKVSKKTYDMKRWDNLKLIGYSNKDIHSLVEFDNGYRDSSLIKGMKVKTDDSFNAYAKVLSDAEIDKLIELTEKNIDSAVDKILDGDFSINPKKIGYDNDLGCKFCKFKDLCFKKDNNYVILEDIKTLDFLGGEGDA
ncbi:MAG: hypothetical protein E7161_02355 [Firmicutes bacterium]|nr:hypothetical protein [Bacillota bacterium]